MPPCPGGPVLGAAALRAGVDPRPGPISMIALANLCSSLVAETFISKSGRGSLSRRRSLARPGIGLHRKCHGAAPVRSKI
eukprot:113382-Hanusia_phi.AAC.1